MAPQQVFLTKMLPLMAMELEADEDAGGN